MHTADDSSESAALHMTAAIKVFRSFPIRLRRVENPETKSGKRAKNPESLSIPFQMTAYKA